MEMYCTNCCRAEKAPNDRNVQDLMKFNETIIPLVLVGALKE